MSTILEQKCPNCGAMMNFDPSRQTLECEYCGTSVKFDPDNVEAESFTEGFHFEDFSQGYERPEALALPIYLCRSCGAELIAPPEQFATTCPYCRNNIVLSDKVAGNLCPNGILPFEVTADALPKLFRKTYSDKKLLPRRFCSDSTMKGVTGVYVPFWLFSGDISGDAEFIGSKSEIRYADNRKYTDTHYYQVHNQVNLVFNDLPVDASNCIADELMDSLEPFDMSKLKPFDIRYLAGYTADRFDTPSKNLEMRARLRIENTADAMLAAECREYENVRRVSGHLTPHLTAKYILMPIYLFNLSYLGKEYSYAVNGQNGKVIGELPNFDTMGRIWFLKRFLGTIGVFLGFFIIRYFLGG